MHNNRLSLTKFIIDNLSMPNGGHATLKLAVELMIARHGEELNGMSEYDIVEIYDEALHKLND